ncbi:helix-hairpin-helix domain-containing protein [Labilibacter sediminis]|nr:helix-hairpin-helix domain-containing protein [Labilibacter sediminis]
MWKGFWLYTRGERRGIAILLILIFVLLVVRFMMPYWANYSTVHVSDQEFERRIKELNDSLRSVDEELVSLFYFNPNTIQEQELRKLGFNTYQCKSFLNYRSKIGEFQSKQELWKVFGVDSSLMIRIDPYIQFPKKVNENSTNSEREDVWIDFNEVSLLFWREHVGSKEIRDSIIHLVRDNHVLKSLPLSRVRKYSDQRLLGWLCQNVKPKYKRDTGNSQAILKVELNSADTLGLMEVNGIGAKLAVRIVKYRELLGGFYSVEQLREVYGLSETNYAKISGLFTVNDNLVRKINPGKDYISVLRKHPYFSEEQSREIINLYRKMDKPTSGDVLSLGSVEVEDFRRQKEYLVIYPDWSVDSDL